MIIHVFLKVSFTFVIIIAYPVDGLDCPSVQAVEASKYL